MIVLGIDPGTIRTGFGVVRRVQGRLIRVDSGTIRLDDTLDVEERLVPLQDRLEEIITANRPDEAAVESLFFSRNAMSALKLGHARGVILLTLARRSIPISSYAPALVKRSIVGHGRAAKGQVQQVVKAILGLAEVPQEDEADALALAICHLNSPARPDGVARPSDLRSRLRPSARPPRDP